MKILVKFPTYKRPEQFFKTLYLYYKKAKNYNDIHFLITIDDNDETMNSKEVEKGFNSYPNLTVHRGESSSKVNAINRGIENYTQNWDILLQASDDMIPVVDGYDDIIRTDMKDTYSDLSGVLWYNDGHQGNRLNTLCIMGREYYARFGYIYFPGYRSLWCDNEFMCVANLLKKQTYFNKMLIQHQHPTAGYGAKDVIHALNDKNEVHDMTLFYERKKHNFFI